MMAIGSESGAASGAVLRRRLKRRLETRLAGAGTTDFAVAGAASAPARSVLNCAE